MQNNKGFLVILHADYVFFETSSTTPYQIRRIEELNKVKEGHLRCIRECHCHFQKCVKLWSCVCLSISVMEE